LVVDGSCRDNPFRFKGREWDEESGLYFLRTRYYDPEVGRFIQRDKIGLAGGWNLYLYTQNNPVNFADPTGEIIPILIGIAVGAGIDLGIQLLQNGGKFECVIWWTVGLSGALGGLGGFLNGARALSNTGRLLLGRNNYGLRRLFRDNRTFNAVSRQYWRQSAGGATAAGNQLGHIWVRNSARWMPQGLRNAGLNLVELPRAINHWGGRSV
jgi:RHS repeat-associated protein